MKADALHKLIEQISGNLNVKRVDVCTGAKCEAIVLQGVYIAFGLALIAEAIEKHGTQQVD